MQVGRRQITVWTEQRHGCGAGALESLQVCHRHAPGGGDPAVRKGCPNTPEFGMKKLTKMCTKSSQSQSTWNISVNTGGTRGKRHIVSLHLCEVDWLTDLDQFQKTNFLWKANAQYLYLTPLLI